MIAHSCLTEPDFATNLRRLLARRGLTVEDLASASGLDLRTLRGVLNSSKRPHSRTLHRLAAALEVPADELFQDPSLLAHRLFDRRTNPVVEQVVAARPELVRGWGEADFDELYSQFGHGGALTEMGVIETARGMNRRREVVEKVELIMQTAEGELLAEMIEVLYRRIRVDGESLRPPLSSAERGVGSAK